MNDFAMPLAPAHEALILGTFVSANSVQAIALGGVGARRPA